jgi:hypothetical protein
MMEAVHASGHTAPTHSSEMVGPQDHAAHLEHANFRFIISLWQHYIL